MKVQKNMQYNKTANLEAYVATKKGESAYHGQGYFSYTNHEDVFDGSTVVMKTEDILLLVKMGLGVGCFSKEDLTNL